MYGPEVNFHIRKDQIPNRLHIAISVPMGWCCRCNFSYSVEDF